MAQLNRLSIKLQILSISGLALLGFISIVAVYLISNSMQNTLQQYQNEAQRIFQLEEELHFKILKARRSDLDYIIQPDVNYIEQRAKVIEQQKSLFYELKTTVQTEIELNYIYNISNLALRYETQFAQISKDYTLLGLDDNSGLRGDLSLAAQKTEDKLTILKATNLKNLMLRIRRHEKDFLLKLDKKYVRQIDQSISKFKKAVFAGNFPANVKNDILKQIERYKAALHTLSQVKLTLIPKERALNIIYGKSQLTMDVFHDRVQKIFQQSLFDTQGNAITTHYVISALIILTATFVISAGIWISTIISRSINGITNAMEELASGKMDVHIPGAGYKNEIGQMFKSVSIFRDTLAENDRLTFKQLFDKFRQIEHAENLRKLILGFENNIEQVLGKADAAVKTINEATPGLSPPTSHKKIQSRSSVNSRTRATEHVPTIANAFAGHSASIKRFRPRPEHSSAAARKTVNKKYSGQVIQLYDKDR